MRRFVTYVLAFAMAGGVAVMAEKAKTAEDLDKAMKRIGPAQQAVNKAIQAMAYVDAKKQLDVVKTTLKDAETFWVTKKKADGTKFTDETVMKIDTLEKLLDAKAPDQAAITTAYREVGTACASCHRVYRATDENNNFILKPGSIQ
jgi:cytochrome c556